MVNATAPSVRAAVPAPWWVFVVTLAVAAAVPAIRRQPICVLPALLSTVPWWPVPLPTIALLWTGPLAWVPIGLATLAAVTPGMPGTSGTPGSLPARGFVVAIALISLAAGGATAWSTAAHVPGGDEPHYLVITQSLLKDGDLRIQNNHDRGDYREYYGGPLEPHVLERSRDGAVYSIHAPGTSVLVLPGFALAGYAGAKWTMLLLMALAAALVWDSALLATGDHGAATFAWAAIAGSATFLLQSGMIFPDGPGALAAAAAMWLAVRLDRLPPPTFRPIVLVSVLVAALPWLHTRFAVLAAMLGVILISRLHRATPPDLALRRIAVFLALPVVSAIAWFAYFFAIYGTVSPMAPYGSTGGSWRYVPGGFLASLFDGQYGLLAYSPVLALAFFAGRKSGRVWLAIASAYLAVVAIYWMWWGGLPATPARFATATLPLFAVPIATVWMRATATARRLLIIWLALSLAISAIVIGADRGALAWNVRDAEPAWLEWLGPVVNLPRALPSFFWKLSVPPAGPDLTSEWPFVIHAAGFAGVLIGCSIAGLGLARRVRTSPAKQAAVIAATVLAGLMVAVSAGWWINGSSGLDAARSQIAVLNAAAAGAKVRHIAPGRLDTPEDPATGLRIRGEEAGVYGRPPWGIFRDLPAGRYDLRVIMAKPTASVLRVEIGRTREPAATYELQRLSEQSVMLNVPSRNSVIVKVDADVAEAGGVVELRPIR